MDMILREGWNAHNDIGIVLENKARRILNPGVVYGADGTIYTADKIEHETFVEVMVCLIRRKFGYNCNQRNDDFIRKAAPIFGKSINSIEAEIAQDLLNEFLRIIE